MQTVVEALNAPRLREKALQIRRAAERIEDDQVRKQMLNVAAQYDHLALLLETDLARFVSSLSRPLK